MKIVFLLFAGALCAQVQDSTVTLSATDPLGAKKTAAVTFRRAQVSYSIDSGTVDASGAATLHIAIASRTALLPSGLQFTLSFTAGDVSAITFSLSSAATAAGKQLDCARGTGAAANSYNCVVTGGLTGIANGVIVNAVVQTSLTSQSSTTTTLVGTVSANAAGGPIPSVVASGGGVIAMPPALAGVSCTPTDIFAGGSIACTVTLNKPAAASTSITLSSDTAALITVPASVAIAAGSASASFQASSPAGAQ